MTAPDAAPTLAPTAITARAPLASQLAYKGWHDESAQGARDVLGPKLIFVTGLVMFVTAVARLVCPDLLG